MLSRLSARERVLVIIFLITLLISLFYRLFLLPAYTDYAGAREQLKQLKSKNVTDTPDSRALREMQALNEDKKNWEAILANYPLGSNGGNFISELGRMSAANSLIIKNIQSFPPVPKGGMMIQPYYIELTGSYSQIIAFIKALEKGVFCINLKNIKMVPAVSKKETGAAGEQVYQNELNKTEGNLLTGSISARLHLDVYNLPRD